MTIKQITSALIRMRGQLKGSQAVDGMLVAILVLLHQLESMIHEESLDTETGNAVESGKPGK